MQFVGLGVTGDVTGQVSQNVWPFALGGFGALGILFMGIGHLTWRTGKILMQQTPFDPPLQSLPGYTIKFVLPKIGCRDGGPHC